LICSETDISPPRLTLGLKNNITEPHLGALAKAAYFRVGFGATVDWVCWFVFDLSNLRKCFCRVKWLANERV
jgi:hypothetical protein